MDYKWGGGQTSRVFAWNLIEFFKNRLFFTRQQFAASLDRMCSQFYNGDSKFLRLKFTMYIYIDTRT